MILKDIQLNQRNEDGSFTINAAQMRILRAEFVTLRRMAWKLMREFKRKADLYCIKTRFNRPYRAAKQFFQQRKGR